MPDEELIKDLEKQLKTGEKELRRVSRELDKLVDLALSGILEKDTIRQKEQSLIQAKKNISEEVEQLREKLHSMPDLSKVKADAERIRIQLLEEYSGPERLKEMSFDDKKTLLHWLFDGQDQDGKPYGIYVNKTGKGKNQKIDYFLYGRITGLRTVKGDDINYQDWDEDDENSGGGNNSQASQKPTKTKDSYKGKKFYKTNSRSYEKA